MSDDDFDFSEMIGMAAEEAPAPVAAKPVSVDTDDSEDDFMSTMGLQVERTVPDITKPWMKHHKFVLVTSIAQLNEIVDQCLLRKECALDLECEGLDSRIFYREDGSPYTKHQIVGFCLSYDGETGFYAPVRHAPADDGGQSLNLPVAEAEAAIKRLCLASQPVPAPGAAENNPFSYKEWAEPPKVVIYFWHAKFDQEFLYPITGLDWWHPESFEDGNLAYFTYYSADKQLSLKDKAFKELHDIDGNPYEMIKLKELFVQGRRDIEFAKLSPDEPGCVKYACSDAICTFLLCTAPRKHETKRKPILKIVREKYNFTYRLEKQTAECGRWMERPRVRVSRAKAEVIRAENIARRDALTQKIADLAAAKGFPAIDLASSKKLSDFLFSDSGLNISLPVSSVDFPNGKPPISDKSGQYTTAADVLEQMLDAHPNPPDILKWVVEWRGFEKLETTYLKNIVENIDERSEMRFQFKQTGAATGRFSAPNGEPSQGYSGIPIHGIPGTSALRQAFEARDGYTMVKSDFAGEELRIVSNISGEPVWIKEFLEGEGDLHTITARAFYGKQEVTKEERKAGKIANFALVYGGGPAAIMRATGCDKLEATRRKQAFDKAVPVFAKWVKSQHAYVRKNKGVWTAFGRWIAIPDIDSPEQKVQAACERHAVNYPIQGAGADIMKICLVLLFKEFYKRKWLKQGGGDDSVRMLLTVHDEIVFEIKHERVQEALVIITKIMASPTHMAMQQHSPKWQVPLVAEPLIGLNWAGEYDYGMLMHGKPYKPSENPKVCHHGKDKTKKCSLCDIEIVVDGRVYHKVPPWLEGKFTPGYVKGDSTSVETPVQPAPVVEEVSSPEPVAPVPPVPTTAVPPPVKESVLTVSKPTDVVLPIVTIKINILTLRTVEQVRKSVCGAYDPDHGQVLCLIDGHGRTLVDPSMGIRIIPDKLAKELRDINLSDGTVYPYVRPSAVS